MNDTVGSFPKVTVILRGYSYEQCRCVVQHLVGTKLNAVEVAMNTPNAALTIAQLVREFGDEVHIAPALLRLKKGQSVLRGRGDIHALSY